MTAYELAEELDYYENDIPIVCQAAFMLKNQANKIKMLEKECAALREQINALSN